MIENGFTFDDSYIIEGSSLVPKPPPFLFFSLQLYSTQKRKSGKIWGRPGNTYHVNDVRWARGEHKGGWDLNNILDFIIEHSVARQDPDFHKNVSILLDW